MPNTPHSSRSVSPSRSSCSSIAAGPEGRFKSRSSWASWSGCRISSEPLFRAVSARRRFLDQLFQAVTSRFTVSVAGARRLRLGISLIIIWFVFLESLQDGVLGVIRQEGHQPIAGSLEYHAGFGPRDPVRALLVRHHPGEEQEGDHDDQKAASQAEQEAQG